MFDKMCSRLLVSSLACVALLSSAGAQEDAFSGEQLSQAPLEGWRTNGGSLLNQRYSPLDEINRDNVSELQGVWRTHLNGSGMDTQNSGEAQPLVHNGVIYIVTGDDDAFAVSVKTGEILWSYVAELPEGLGKSLCCSWVSRGLGLGDGKVYVGQLDSKLVALDQNTGEVVWEVQAEAWEDGYSITSAPLYYDGMVITGFAGAEYGIRGTVKAYDSSTGELVWNFNVIPGPGEFGHDTWPADNDIWKYGGGSVWQTPAVDVELDLMYFSTGNPGPDFNGYMRAGDNLFTDSIVAVDAHTGEYRWHFQQVHHDIWDYDAPNPVILFDIEVNGEMRKAIAEAGKTGWVYLLDRITGEPLLGIPERPVMQHEGQKTSATQPYPVGDSFIPQFIDVAPEGADLVNQGRIFTPYGEGQAVLFQPSTPGGANWPASAYDPSRGIMYICATESAMSLVGGGVPMDIPDEPNGELFAGGGGFGPISKTQTGVVAAMDMTTNTLVWQYRWPENCASGFVATAGDLLFVGRNDGRLTALDIDTGHEIWSFQTGAGMNSSVSIFEEEGQQYIVAYSAGNLFAGSYHGDSLWLFALDGTLPETTEGDTAKALTQSSANAAVDVVFAEGAADLAAGKQLFSQTCLPCHGEDGMGGHNGGAPLNNLTDIKQAITVVTTGRNGMPTFFGALSPEQIRDVSGYVLEGLFE